MNTIELARGLYEDDDREETLRGMRSALTNFQVGQSEDGQSYSIWAEAHDIFDDVGLFTQDMIERDDFIDQLQELGFKASVSGDRESWRDQPTTICILKLSEFEFRIEFLKGYIKCGLKAARDRSRVASFEISRDYLHDRWSDSEIFGIVFAAAKAAKESKNVEAVAQTLEPLQWHSDEEVESAISYRPAKWNIWSGIPILEFSDVKKLQCRLEAEQSSVLPSLYNIASYMTLREAMDFVRSSGDAVTNFYTVGWDSIWGEVVDNLSRWDFRSAEQMIRDTVIESLQRRGYAAKFVGEYKRFSPPDIALRLKSGMGYVEFVIGQRLRLRGVENSETSEDGEFWLKFADNPEARVTAIGLLPFIADVLDAGGCVQKKLLGLGLEWIGYPDDTDPGASFPSEAFEGGYIGDGMWIGGASGIQDLGR